MNHNPEGLSDGVADGGLPLSARIAVAREGIQALDRKLITVAREQADIAARIGRDDDVGPEIRQQEAELKKLRAQADQQRLVLIAYVAKLELERSA